MNLVWNNVHFWIMCAENYCSLGFDGHSQSALDQHLMDNSINQSMPQSTLDWRQLVNSCLYCLTFNGMSAWKITCSWLLTNIKCWSSVKQGINRVLIKGISGLTLNHRCFYVVITWSHLTKAEWPTLSACSGFNSLLWWVKMSSCTLQFLWQARN